MAEGPWSPTASRQDEENQKGERYPRARSKIFENFSSFKTKEVTTFAWIKTRFNV